MGARGWRGEKNANGLIYRNLRHDIQYWVLPSREIWRKGFNRGRDDLVKVGPVQVAAKKRDLTAERRSTRAPRLAHAPRSPKETPAITGVGMGGSHLGCSLPHQEVCAAKNATPASTSAVICATGGRKQAHCKGWRHREHSQHHASTRTQACTRESHLSLHRSGTR